jgi:uncharacterized protein YdcH (DUF465 family)
MRLEKQTLIKNGPDHQHTIRHLKNNDAHFVELFDSYHELESEVYNIEKCSSPVVDVYIRSLKKRRLDIKNELFDIIQKTERTILSEILTRSIKSLQV